MLIKAIKQINNKNFFLYQPSDLSFLELKWGKKEKYIILTTEVNILENIEKNIKGIFNRYKNSKNFLLNLKIQRLLNDKFYQKFYNDFKVYNKYEKTIKNFKKEVINSLKILYNRKKLNKLEKFFLLKKIKLFNEVNKKFKDNYYYKFLNYNLTNKKLINFLTDNNYDIKFDENINVKNIKFADRWLNIEEIYIIFNILDRYIEYRSKYYKNLSLEKIKEQDFLHLYFKYYFNILAIDFTKLHTFIKFIYKEHVYETDLIAIISLYCIYNQLSLILYKSLNYKVININL